MRLTKGDVVIEMDRYEMEKFLSGEEPWKVELRSSIVQYFSKRYLKGIIEPAYLSELEKQISQEAQKAVREELEGKNPNLFRPSLPSDKVALIRANVKASFGQLVESEINSALLQYKEFLEEKKGWFFKNLMTKYAEEFIEKEVQRRMQVICQRIQSRLPSLTEEEE